MYVFVRVVVIVFRGVIRWNKFINEDLNKCFSLA